MRSIVNNNRSHDPRINYRGTNASRLDNLTDSVFGIAITLLIFNLTNPNTYADLITFTKTLPAFLISITFLILVWKEHVRFAEIYTYNDSWLLFFNTIFLALVIFYVYPLRFLTLFLTNLFFNTELQVSIEGYQVPRLMMYYGCVAFALYFTMYLMFRRALKLKDALQLNGFEVFFTKEQKKRLTIMFGVPVISILVTFIVSQFSFVFASMLGGFAYALYTPAMLIWSRRYERKSNAYSDSV